MGLIEDIYRFLETRLDDFIRTNPRIELHLLDEKLQQQEQDVSKLIIGFQQQEQQFQQQILALAEDVSLWHRRAQKAREAGQTDLANAAEQREASFLKQGNQVWAQMELVKQRLQQVQDLLKQIHERRQEVKEKFQEFDKTETKTTKPDRVDWENLRPPVFDDDVLEQKFRRWELDEELDHLKDHLQKVAKQKGVNK